MAASTNSEMQALIKVINELHDALASTGAPIQIDLPQIAVVGGQSAGKSSVLENIAGRDFLPRGSDIVTRRPLVLQMYNHTEEYAEFLHEPGKRYTDYDAVRREIEEETERKVKGKNVSSHPINLKWFSPNVVDLTLVDLPGLTKNPIGDQDPNIVHQIRDMVIEFIQPENTIILAVSPANQDIATSDAIQVAKLVDPEGNRTIGVLTKLDLMDAGTDAREVLENRLLPLKRGYIGVVNRSQKDINDKKRIEKALEAEQQFFRTHPAYRHMADRMGTKHLQQALSQMLHSHIKEKLPGIRSNLHAKKRDLAERIRDMGGIDESPPSRMSQFNKNLGRFQAIIEREIYGHRLDIEIHEMSVGVMINKTYYQEISGYLDENVRPEPDLIMQILSNIAGVQNQLFPSEQTIKIVVGQIVKRYEDPLRQSCVLVAGLLRTLVEKACRKLEDVPSLQVEISYLVNEKIQEHQELAKSHLLSYVKAEAAFINTKHPDFRFKSPDSIRDLESQGYNDAKHEVADRSSVVQQNGSRTTPQPTPSAGSQLPSPSNVSPVKSNSKLFSGMMKAKFHHMAARALRNKVEKKEFFFVLTTSSLSWYKNPKEDDMRGSINVTADVNCKSASDSKGLMRFTFRRSAGGTLCPPDIEILEITPIRKEDSDVWSSKLGETPMRLERSSSLTSLRSIQVDSTDSSVDYALESMIAKETTKEKKADWMTDLRRDQTKVGWKNMVVAIVEDYMNIVDKTVHDLTPKYLNTFLVEKTVEYVKEELSGHLLGDSNVERRLESLMTISGDREKKKRELVDVLKATENALKILGDMSMGSHQQSEC